MAPKVTLVSSQPGKTVYSIFFLLSCFVRIPVLGLYFIPSGTRPRKSWSWFQSFTNAVTKLVLDFLATIRFRTPRSIEPGVDKTVYEWMPPAKTQVYAGPCAQDDSIKPNDIGGIWVPEKFDRDQNESKPVVLHFHGGAFVLMSPRLAATRWGPAQIHKALGSPVLMPIYRLSSDPECQFPAALQDAITAYKYLLDELKVPVSRIVLSGDSAGANLVLALLRYISEHDTLLPCPPVALLWSPWTNLTDPDSYGVHPNFHSDYLTPTLGNWGAQSYASDNVTVSDPYISPALHPFHTKARLVFNFCTAEVLADEIQSCYKAFKGVDGNDIKITKIEEGAHDMFAAGGTNGFEEAACKAIEESVAFAKDVL